MLIAFSLFVPTILSVTQEKSTLEDHIRDAQCFAKCARQYGTFEERRLLSGEIERKVFAVQNRSAFSLCKIGCENPNSENVGIDSFYKGQSFSVTSAQRVTNVQCPQEVSLLCANISTDLSSETIKFIANIRPHNETDSVFVLQIVGESGIENSSNEVILDTFLAFSRTPSHSVNRSLHSRSFKLRALTVTTDGSCLVDASSPWYKADEMFSSVVSVEIFVRSQRLSGDSVVAVLGFKFPHLSVPKCLLYLEWNYYIFTHRQFFVLDQSLSFAIQGLLFSREYSVRLFETDSIGKQGKLLGSLQFITVPCYQLTDDPSLCPPPAVKSGKWKELSKKNFIRISWEYDYLKGDDAETALVVPYHFLVEVWPLSDFYRISCQNVKPISAAVPPSRMYLDLYVTELCDYRVSITVIDMRNRTSAPHAFTKWNIDYRKIWTGREVAAICILFFVSLMLLSCLIYTIWECCSSSGEETRCSCWFTATNQGSLSSFSYELTERRVVERNSAEIVQTTFSRTDRSDDEQTPQELQRTSCLSDTSLAVTNTRNASRFFSPESRLLRGSCCARSERPMATPEADRSGITGAVYVNIPFSGLLPPEAILRTEKLSNLLDGSTSVASSKLDTTVHHDYALSVNSLGNFASLVLRARSAEIDVIQLENVKILETLGSGNFGSVVRIDLHGRHVALKTDGATLECGVYLMQNLYREAQMSLDLCTTGHENITQLLGLLYSANDFTDLRGLAFECCEGGNLKTLLRNMHERASQLASKDPDIFKTPTSTEGDEVTSQLRSDAWQKRVVSELTKFSYQIACAMDYISLRRYVHQDIAARNVLLTKGLTSDPFEIIEGQVVKISDFGLCTALGGSDCVIQSRQRKLPFKWLPYEFWTESAYGLEGDVWEYGCFLIEVLTFGGDPGIVVHCGDQIHPRDDIQQYLEKVSTGFKAFDILFDGSLRTVARQALICDKSCRITFNEICKVFATMFPASEALV